MRKMRRFNGEDGSEVSDETLNKLRQDQSDRMARMANSSESSSRETPAATPVAAAPKAKPAIVTLKQLDAFKAKYGADKELTDYMNAQQGLKRRNAPPPSTPSTPNESGSGRGPTVEKAQASKEAEFKKAEEEAQSAAGKAKRAAMEKSQAVENVYPEQALLGGAGFGIKSIAKAAQNLANRGGVKEVAKRGEPIYREPKLEILKDISQPLALPKPTPRLGFDKAGAKAAERSGRAKGRQAEMLKENARRSGLREDASAETSKAVRDKLGGKNFTVKKHGGSVKGYASGGSVSSRADGIAQRGKTRGKMC
jgi:hypothetical protein